MALNYDDGIFLRAQQEKNRNFDKRLQDIQSIGQSIGQTGQQFAKLVQDKQKKQAWQKAINEYIQNPNTPAQNKQFGPILSQAGPDNGTGMLEKLMSQSKASSPWRVVSGMLSKNGKPVQQNELTGEVREAGLDVVPTGRGNASFGMGSINWDSASQEDKDLAQALYEGRIRTSDLGYRDRSVGTKLANQYALKKGLPAFKSYAGDVAAGTSKAFASGKFGMNQLSLDTALGHVDTAYDAYQGIQNTDQEWVNKPLNALRKSTNDPNVVKLGVTLNALRGELANVFKNSGGTDQEIASWKDYLNENLTPSQINAVIPQIDQLLRSRLSALEYQRQSGMSGRNEMPLLSPHAAKISDRMNKVSSNDVQVTNFSVSPSTGAR
jgi:hypothetical protein